MQTRVWLLPLLVACGGKDDPTDENTDDGITEHTDGTVSAPTDKVDPNCIDGTYTEAIADADASLATPRGSFNSNRPEDFLIEALEIRYPTGAYIFEEGIKADSFTAENCFETFITPSQRQSADGMLDAASTLVHECGHFLDIELGGFVRSTYVITEDLQITCDGGSLNDTPARSRILGDEYASLRPPCAGAGGGSGCDTYAPIYLDGNPDDGNFDGGDQGLDSVLEEATQYVNSLATDYAFNDRLGAGAQISARDGILTFLWYIERYLRWMRVNDNAAYGRILNDPCWREAILTVWGRAWIFLAQTEGIRSLSLEGDAIEALVLDTNLLQEIQRVRDAEGC